MVTETEILNLTEWILFKIKIIYGRPTFEGDTPNEALAVRQVWQDIAKKIGKKGAVATIDYLLSGHNSVPSYPPSSVDFIKCYEIHVSPYFKSAYRLEGSLNCLPLLKKEHNPEAYKKFQAVLKQLKPDYKC